MGTDLIVRTTYIFKPCAECGSTIGQRATSPSKLTAQGEQDTRGGIFSLCEHCRAEDRKRHAPTLAIARTCQRCERYWTPSDEPSRGKGRLGKLCVECRDATWDCRWCRVDIRTSSRQGMALAAVGHRTYPAWRSGQQPSCDRCARVTARLKAHKARLAKAQKQQMRTFFGHTICNHCGSSQNFVTQGASTQGSSWAGCSDLCSKRIKSALQQHARYEAYRRAQATELVLVGQVYARDKGTCQICLKPVPSPGTLSHSHPDAPNVDHVTPLYANGDHTYANVRLTHHSCNVRRERKELRAT